MKSKNKTRLMAIRVAEKDYRELEEKAEKEKLTTSSFARHLIFKALQTTRAELKETA
jgi:hypothetical protein